MARAELVSALYEQGKVHHIGTFPQLEDQMCAFTTDFDRARAGYSPDRLDALVIPITARTQLIAGLVAFEIGDFFKPGSERVSRSHRNGMLLPSPRRKFALR